jgi:hypothetical protein
MDTRRREQIQRSLRSLADCCAATLETMEQTLALLGDDPTLDPLTYFRTRVRAQDPLPGPQPLGIGPARRARPAGGLRPVPCCRRGHNRSRTWPAGT